MICQKYLIDMGPTSGDLAYPENGKSFDPVHRFTAVNFFIDFKKEVYKGYGKS